jgi:RNA polymerase sigma-70 factor, ECF subfamily
MHVRTEKRDVRRDISLDQMNASLEQSTIRLNRALADSDESPSAGAERRERAVVLADVMSQLSADHRQVLVLRNLQGLPFAEVAERMGRSVPAAKMLWMRAVRRLRQQYETWGK